MTTPANQSARFWREKALVLAAALLLTEIPGLVADVCLMGTHGALVAVLLVIQVAVLAAAIAGFTARAVPPDDGP
jgi:hypothetical protein